MIYIPEKIRVGYQNRKDTYTGKLAYVIYYKKDKLMKETSWQSWRDENIEPDDFDNVPTEGFVLNKKVGDYKSDWNHRMAYSRVYDPRGFEFEITIDNLLFILENATSTKGKGLEGQFVYGWDGKDLILMPVDCPDYIEQKANTDMQNTNGFIKDLKFGAVYENVGGEKYVYLGKHWYRRYDCWDFEYANEEAKSKYWFAELCKDDRYYTNIRSSKPKYVKMISERYEKLDELVEELNNDPDYNEVVDYKIVKRQFNYNDKFEWTRKYITDNGYFTCDYDYERERNDKTYFVYRTLLDYSNISDRYHYSSRLNKLKYYTSYDSDYSNNVVDKLNADGIHYIELVGIDCNGNEMHFYRQPEPDRNYDIIKKYKMLGED